MPFPVYSSAQKPLEQSGVATQERVKTKRPSMYRVILLNDDFTPMDFVVHVLKKFFDRSESEAMEVMLQVHHQGAGVAGVYQYDIAEMKVVTVNAFAKKNQHPLKCIMEKESSHAES